MSKKEFIKKCKDMVANFDCSKPVFIFTPAYLEEDTWYCTLWYHAAGSRVVWKATLWTESDGGIYLYKEECVGS